MSPTWRDEHLAADVVVPAPGGASLWFAGERTEGELAAGESRRVTFEVDASQLAYTNLARQVAVEPAPVDVFVGLHSDDRSLVGSFAVVGAARVVDGAERSFLSRARPHP